MASCSFECWRLPRWPLARIADSPYTALRPLQPTPRQGRQQVARAEHRADTVLAQRGRAAVGHGGAPAGPGGRAAAPAAGPAQGPGEESGQVCQEVTAPCPAAAAHPALAEAARPGPARLGGCEEPAALCGPLGAARHMLRCDGRRGRGSTCKLAPDLLQDPARYSRSVTQCWLGGVERSGRRCRAGKLGIASHCPQAALSVQMAARG